MGPDPTKGMTLVILSFATSIDALAAGFSLSLLGVAIWAPVVTIESITGCDCCRYVVWSDYRNDLRKRVEFLDGLILI